MGCCQEMPICKIETDRVSPCPLLFWLCEAPRQATMVAGLHLRAKDAPLAANLQRLGIHGIYMEKYGKISILHTLKVESADDFCALILAQMIECLSRIIQCRALYLNDFTVLELDKGRVGDCSLYSQVVAVFGHIFSSVLWVSRFLQPNLQTSSPLALQTNPKAELTTLILVDSRWMLG